MVKTNRVWTFVTAGIIGGALLFSLASEAVCQQQETAEQSIERVKKAIKNDEWGRAQSEIRQALALKPDSAEANLIAAQVYYHEEARSMAIDSLTKAIESQPIFPEAHFLLAQCLKESKKLEKAREEVNIALSQSTPLFSAYRLLAEIDIAKGDFEGAITSLETALRFSPATDGEDAARLREQIEQSREFAENLKRFAVLEAGQKAPDVIRPVLLNLAQPRYTEEARALKIQGTVSMGVLVTENGDVDSVLIFRGLGHGLDEQAADVARKLKFAPATRSGKPIPYWTKLSVQFNLK
ncbi:MAG TPA: TonB family protein [Blastocatellia bacterium]|nr:TonB family protein [Blastocatellia bacterium]